MKLISRVWIGVRALRELGPAQVGQNALYQLGLRSGHYQRQLRATLHRLDNINRTADLTLRTCLPGLPERKIIANILGDGIGKLYQQADEIVDGKIRLFGGEPVPLNLKAPDPREEWTKYEFMDGRVNGQDIKFIWEPGRFSWACTLARAYYLGGNERYVDVFWEYYEHFFASNAPYFGPHWCSAQEVAIRLIALTFAYQIFALSKRSTPERVESLARSITVHAERIPPTLVYARSQNNNHLLMEALGLYTASAMLPSHPLAAKWHTLGWKWLLYAFHTQIESDGSYIQHSTNYHRMMLQAALWMYAIHDFAYPAERIPAKIEAQLANATRWILRLLDPSSGKVPNLGHNDGAYILPLTICPYNDYRPVISAAGAVFLHTRLIPQGKWEEMGEWLGISSPSNPPAEKIASWNDLFERHELLSDPPHRVPNPADNSWAYFRVADYRSRPAHADQLHLDLWWHGLNLALDPGTYLYNSPSPWENSLTSAFVHNTVTIDGQEFMQRAGRFLYLDWAQAKILVSQDGVESKSHTIKASHDGYRRSGITHTRTVTTYQDGHWDVEDCLDGPPGSIHTVRLHWLLPDWEYELLDLTQDNNSPGYGIILRSPRCKVTLHASIIHYPDKASKLDKVDFKLARAGELLVGSGSIPPISGYYSPTYGVKVPALAYILEAKGDLPITIKSQWFLPRPKAAVILIENNRVALIERNRPGRHYFVIPGGKIEPGETPAMAASREAREELGLEVKIDRLVAEIWYQGRSQYYFLAEAAGGSFGLMSGPEIRYPPGLQKGTYQPTWMPVDELLDHPVVPEQIAKLIAKSHLRGWPETPLLIPEPSPDEGI